MTTTHRHSWSDPVRFQNDRGENTKTERTCVLCRLVKVTMHPPEGFPWREWWRDGERIEAEGTPVCDPGEQVRAMA